ncbi:hypothetical protein ACHAW6_002868 [Cyclotella cf. meneghiniana]
MSDQSPVDAPPKHTTDADESPHPFPANEVPNQSSSSGPRRYIYTQADMEHFRHSSARKELLSFVTAMGRGLTNKAGASSAASSSALPPTPHNYDPARPLRYLTPALASLHGSLSCMARTWMDADHPDGIPPDRKAKARFGNPAFRTWHARLVQRSYGIVKCCLDCHRGNCERSSEKDELEVLVECSRNGYRAASTDGSHELPAVSSNSNEQETIEELRAYLHDAFGHPIRIDYGTGHESSFVVFLLALCKIGCFAWMSRHKDDTNDIKSNPTPSPAPPIISRASLALFHAYLSVTRGLQRDYMLEPAGSHGVWGLDDYHCIPFYVGACQMVAREQWQQHQLKEQRTSAEGALEQTTLEKEESDGDVAPIHPYLPDKALPDPKTASRPLINHNDNLEQWDPSIIHNRHVLETHRQTYLYLSCIHFIQEIKPNVPFFESSPMLNDISSLGNWNKVSSGLLRLYEGEVLDKLPVVQHFVFGKIFCANWSPSRKGPLEAPQWTFINGPMGDECIAPWAYGNNSINEDPQGDGSLHRRASSGSSLGGIPPTRAPWAK